MHIDEEIIFSQQEQHELTRMLQYIDFRCSQHRTLPDIDEENITATTISALLLSGISYNEEQLRKIIESNDTSQDAQFIHRYRQAVADLLSNNADTYFDEMRIMSLYNQLYNDNSARLYPTKIAHAAYTAPSSYTTAHANDYHHIDVHSDLSDLVEWFLVPPSNNKWHPLIRTAIFLYRFVAQDTLDQGKDEMVHLISLLLLQRHQAQWIDCYTPCRDMSSDILTYHRTLKGRENIGYNIGHWIKYWIKHVYEAAQSAAKRHAPILPAASPQRISIVNTRQRKILDFIEEKQPVKLSDIAGHLHKESINTIKKDLQHLRQLGYITADGVLKGTVYYRD